MGEDEGETAHRHIEKIGEDGVGRCFCGYTHQYRLGWDYDTYGEPEEKRERNERIRRAVQRNWDKRRGIV